MITLKSNIGVLTAQRYLANATSQVESTSLRQSSGLRINSPSDDSAGLAVALDLQITNRVDSQGLRNISDGISVLNIADGALKQLKTLTYRQKELAEQSANGIYSLKQRKAIQKESDQLVDEFNRIVSSTKFNGLNLLDGTFGSSFVAAGSGSSADLNIGIGTYLSHQVGDGTFTLSQSVGPVASAAFGDIVSGDLDNDGKEDLVFTDAFAHRVGVMLGNGDNSFKAPVYYSNFSNPGSLAIVNTGTGNSSQKAIVIAGYPSTSYVYQVNSNGTLQYSSASPNSYQGGTAVVITKGDINGDGLDDIVTSGTTLSVRVNQGGGSFSSAVSIGSLAATATDVATADLNGDGRVDIISGYNANYFAVSLGNGDGTFQSASTVSSSGGALNRVFTGDFNRDGNADVITLDTGGGTVREFLGNRNGSFASAVTVYTNGSVLSELQVGDANGDGYDDLVAVSSTSNQLACVLGNGNGSFSTARTSATNIAYGLVLDDFNGDGAIDAGVVSHSTTMGVMTANSTARSTIGYVNLLSATGAKDALATSSSVLDRIIFESGNVGSRISRLQYAQANLAQQRENGIAAYSRIVDADIATESANYVAARIKQQTATAVLATVSRSPQLALKLLDILK